MVESPDSKEVPAEDLRADQYSASAGYSQPRGRRTLQLGLAITLAGLAAALATFRHGEAASYSPIAIALCLALIAFLPPIWFASWLTQRAYGPLIIFSWRFMILLPALALASQLNGVERNCYVSVLLACYFVGLPLESWLLFREARRLDS